MMRFLNPGEGMGNEGSVYKDLPGFSEIDQVEGIAYQQSPTADAAKRMNFQWKNLFEWKHQTHQTSQQSQY